MPGLENLGYPVPICAPGIIEGTTWATRAEMLVKGFTSEQIEAAIATKTPLVITPEMIPEDDD